MKEFILFIFVGFLCHVNSNPIKPNDDPKIDYRLDSDFSVDSYKLVITTGNLEEDETFKGTVDIKLIAIKDTNSIKLHVGQNLEIDQTKVSVILKHEYDETKDKPIDIDDVTSYTPNEAAIITITLKETIKKDEKIVLKFQSYQSEFSKDLYGFYLTTFDGKDGKYKIAATQFQPTHARKVFPCLDEPRYKARFDINIVHPLNYYGISNQDGYSTHHVGDKVATSIFEETPRISTYSVAFAVVTNYESKGIKHVDEYHCGNFGVELCYSHIYTPLNPNKATDYALEETPKIVKELNDFTEQNYWRMNMRSLKLISIPDLEAGAMENWGLVTLRSNALLIDEDKSTERDKQDVSTTIAHEFAHMWFGNYVTLEWWDYTWLNEGFATFFAYFITDLVQNGRNEAWNMEQQFIVEKMQPVLLDDGFENTKSLNYPVEKPNEIVAKFDSISFNKGASIIRMLKYAVGDEEFQKAIAKYFSKSFRKENVTPKDLYEVFDESGKTKWVDFMESWTNQAGYPLITVRRKGELTETPTEKPTNAVLPVNTKERKNEDDDEDQVIEIKQERFLYKHDKKEENYVPKNKQLWKIWLTYATKEDNKTTKSVEFNGETHELTIPNQDLPIFNVDQTGYYRVKYEGGLLNELKKNLKAKDTSISTINRAQIVDDYMNFARAGKISYDQAFEVISFLENEVEYLPWYAALNSFSFLRKRFSEENIRRKINVQMRKLMVTVLKEIKNENRMENHFDMLRKVLILEWCTEVNEKTCIDETKRLFEMYKHEENWIPPTTARAPIIETRKEAESKLFVNWRGLVLCSGLRISDNEDDWQFVKHLLKTKTFPQEQARIITALGCTKKIKQLEEYLEMTIKVEPFRNQDKIAVFNAVLTGNPEGVQVASKFLQNHYAYIALKFHGVNALSEMINNVADRLTTKAQMEEFMTFLEKNKGELKVDTSQAIETIKINQQWIEKNKDALEQFYENFEDDDNDFHQKVINQK